MGGRAAGNIDPTLENDFNLIFNHHWWLVMLHIRKVIYNHALAEDLTQETFLRAYRRLGALRDETPVPSWLLSIADGVMRDSRRRRKMAHESDMVGEELALNLPADAPTPEQALAAKEELMEITRVELGKLNESEQRVLILYAEGLNAEEIAERTGSSTATVYRRLKRAQATVARRLGTYPLDEPNPDEPSPDEPVRRKVREVSPAVVELNLQMRVREQLDEIDKAVKRMRLEQQEIDRLRDETRRALARLEAV